MNTNIPYIALIIAGAFLGWIGVSLGAAALGTAALLVILEVTLSFDNAVVNAGVLQRMTPIWQKRFLTWGMVIAVFGARAILPILIVSASTLVSPFVIAWIALNDSVQYGVLLEKAHYTITTFGGLFLAMVALKYFFNESKDVHWIDAVEKRLSNWGKIEAIEIILSLFLLLCVAGFLPEHRSEVLFSGIIGIMLFVGIQAVIGSFAIHDTTLPGAGLALFTYLNILDTAFSLDGVVGAFALSTNILIITVGLGIGAYFVRWLTIYLVHHGTLGELIYIEHGAHWAVLGLAAVMLAELFVDVPQPITGFIGFAFLALAYLSSRRALR